MSTKTETHSRIQLSAVYIYMIGRNTYILETNADEDFWKSYHPYNQCYETVIEGGTANVAAAWSKASAFRARSRTTGWFGCLLDILLFEKWSQQWTGQDHYTVYTSIVPLLRIFSTPPNLQRLQMLPRFQHRLHAAPATLPGPTLLPGIHFGVSSWRREM